MSAEKRDYSFKDPFTPTEMRRRLEFGRGTCNDETADLNTILPQRK